MDVFPAYREIWLVDFEFHQPDGGLPAPICMVARELRTGRTLRVWEDSLARMPGPPFPTDPESLFVAYYASAELGCFLSLEWPMPARILDLFCEFRNHTNGRPTADGRGLIGALAHYRLSRINAAEKHDMRELAMRGGPYDETDREALLDYCESDVVALAKLLPAMVLDIDLPRALLRGRYMAAAAHIERAGTPIDVPNFKLLRTNWLPIQSKLVDRIDADYGVYEMANALGKRRFSTALFADWLTDNDIPWPHLDSGRLALDDDTFRQMASRNPQVAPLRELRQSLGRMRLFSDLAVGSDGRNRCLLSAFQARTGRNQPSNAKFIFGPSCWLRSLIRPEPGRALAYVDWSQQEFGIAAALSGDQAMMDAYSSGDPYLSFAKQAGAVPVDATKASHPSEREQFKVCALAVQYGMGEWSLGQALGQPPVFARRLLALHRTTYPTFWGWSEAAVNHAMLHGWLPTVFGWRVHVGTNPNPRSLSNFPMQANGAEMLRLACCLATERDIVVCAPVHDALLIEGSVEEIDQVVGQTQAAMVEASQLVLSGFELRSDAKIVLPGDRYVDPRGEKMWATVMEILAELQQAKEAEPEEET